MQANNVSATYHVVSTSEGEILGVYGEAILSHAQDRARMIENSTGRETMVHTIVSAEKPRVGGKVQKQERTRKISLTGLRATMMRMALNAAAEPGRTDGVHVALSNEKKAVKALERMGLVTIQDNGTKCAGFAEWYYRATPMALAAKQG